MAATLNNLASLLDHMGRYGEALPKYEEALGLYRGLWESDRGNSVYASRFMGIASNLSLFHRGRGELAEAMGVLQTSLGLCKQTGYRRGEAEALLGVVQLLLVMGDDREAERRLEEAAEISKQHGYDDLLARVAAAGGDISLHRRDFQKASQLYFSACAASLKHGWNLHNAIVVQAIQGARTLAERGERDAAVGFLQSLINRWREHAIEEKVPRFTEFVSEAMKEIVTVGKTDGGER